MDVHTCAYNSSSSMCWGQQKNPSNIVAEVVTGTYVLYEANRNDSRAIDPHLLIDRST